MEKRRREKWYTMSPRHRHPGRYKTNTEKTRTVQSKTDVCVLSKVRCRCEDNNKSSRMRALKKKKKDDDIFSVLWVHSEKDPSCNSPASIASVQSVHQRLSFTGWQNWDDDDKKKKKAWGRGTILGCFNMLKPMRLSSFFNYSDINIDQKMAWRIHHRWSVRLRTTTFCTNAAKKKYQHSDFLLLESLREPLVLVSTTIRGWLSFFNIFCWEFITSHSS